ncbi:putative protein tyrosine phosphatase [Heterostelium album PN500]|uniref:Protein-serine/threonine phosphatase n=1 Tax=Heterostelium pallidum (strain ATCC 26659 / Pp 5 / PN500) TaxID=670386 RepID=D3BRR5_HETP5|nr:putative protein tyrosine phosphatase [Heterostelium album PN500]EFA76097.1 putative protein tyrosine phosphatase [Heterostelium album PN500]|eukprot:XP_020428231.1 putative protein tyrosine phosphatase [Heterostelium album PN500]
MSFLNELKNNRKLKNVDTVITNKDGTKHKVNITTGSRSELHSDDENAPQSLGFVVDTKPDDQCYRCDLSEYNDSANLFIGSQDAAFNRQHLDHHGITRILNVGYGIANLYANDGIGYMNIDIYDDVDYNIYDHFSEAFQFLDLAISEQRSILIHCNAGISRSSTILIAYLMKRHHLTLEHAYSIVKKARPLIKPNQGFYNQLKNYEK